MISIMNSRIFNPFFVTGKKKIRQTLPPTTNCKTDLKKIFQTYHQPVFKLCLQVTKDYETAEALTVEVFVEFYKEWSGSDKTETFGKRLRELTVSRLLSFQMEECGQ